MCGLVAWGRIGTSDEAVAPDLVESMLEQVSHRGPDQMEVLREGHVAHWASHRHTHSSRGRAATGEPQHCQVRRPDVERPATRDALSTSTTASAE